MNVLMIGSGGREHALAWKLAQSKSVDTVFVAPGNAGTAHERKCQNVDISPSDFDALASFARENSCGLTVVGPEAPLVDGIVDHFALQQLACFGPTAAAAQLEGSKAFTKDFLARHNIPTAAYQSFTEVEPALAYLHKHGAPIVVKADGDFHEVLVPFSAMKRTWSEQTALDPHTLNSLSIVAYSMQKAAFNFEVDDVGFY